jgi:hypothetical protein
MHPSEQTDDVTNAEALAAPPSGDAFAQLAALLTLVVDAKACQARLADLRLATAAVEQVSECSSGLA